LALSLYFKSDGERHVLSALARMRTLRVMRSVASMARPDQDAPAKVMVEKLQKIWKEEEHERLTATTAQTTSPPSRIRRVGC
jgi:hypothetical protein